MAKVSIVLEDGKGMELKVWAESNPPFPNSQILMSNAQNIAMQILSQFEALHKNMAKNEDMRKLNELVSK